MSHSPPCSSSSPWSPPQVVIDDRDPRITYYGSWITDLGEGSSRWGNSFNDTTHRSQLSSTPSNITFSFKGTAFSVLGDIEDIPTANTSSSYEMVQSCIIDGQTNGASRAPVSTGILCGAEGLADAEHEVMFTAHATGPRTSGYLVSVDAVQYTPSTATNATDVTMMVDACDASLSFEDNWTAFDPPQDSGLTNVAVPLGFKTRFKGVSTNQHGAQVTYDFEGTKVKWHSTIQSMLNTSIERNPAFVKFTIHTSDSQDMNFDVQLSPELVNETQYNHVVFTSPDLSPGNHRLVATYNGNVTTIPLTLSYLYVYSASSDATATSTGGPSQGALSQSSSHLGAIIGGAVGGFFGLLLVLVLGWVAYHRRQRKVEMKAWDVVWKSRNRHMQEALEMGTQKTPKSETA